MLILGFILIRDAMTPLGLWRLGTVGGVVPWLRFTTDTTLLAALGVATLVLTAWVLASDQRLRALIPRQRPDLAAIGLGIAGAAAAAGPVIAIASHWPPAARGGAVALSAVPVILFFCLAGNLFEEVLFRGLLQTRLAQAMSPVRAALLSGLLFAACRIFLASTVTDLGWPLLVFTRVGRPHLRLPAPTPRPYSGRADPRSCDRSLGNRPTLMAGVLRSLTAAAQWCQSAEQADHRCTATVSAIISGAPAHRLVRRVPARYAGKVY